MSAKEIKAALKAAKTAIQSKNYEEAQQQCQFILKKDGGNYNALVFQGLCYSETGQNKLARESYKDAIKSEPDQLLAYQGLANLYSKHWEEKKTKDELDESISVYEKVLSLMGRKEMKKYVELVSTLCDAYIESGSLEKGITRLEHEIGELQKTADEENEPVLRKTVLKCLDSDLANAEFKKTHSQLIISSFLSFLNRSGISSREAMSTLDGFVTFLHLDQEILESNLTPLLDVCIQLHENHQDEALPLEILIQSRIQRYEHPGNERFDSFCEKLEQIGSKLANIGFAFQQRETWEQNVYDKLKFAMEQFPTFLPGWILACEMNFKIHKYKEVENAARSGLVQYKKILNGEKTKWKVPVLSLDHTRHELTRYLAAAMCSSHNKENVERGIETFRKLLRIRRDTFSSLQMSLGLVKLEKYQEAAQALEEILSEEPENIEALSWKAYMDFKAGKIEESLATLRSLPPSPASLFLLGKSMWEAGGDFRTKKENCFTALVKAAKLDAHNAEIFLFLGHFYSQVQHDTARAKGCYQKSYQLDPGSEETASSLADAYIADGNTSPAITLYESITNEVGSSSGKWAWLRLGLCRLREKDINNAIQCFQTALRIDSDDAICWECLGEGYLQRGSFTAAWKAFDRAHEVNPTSVYSLYQMAKVKQVQGLYPDAIKEFSNVLSLFPEYVPALQGLGESELLHARQMMNVGRFQTGVGHSQSAIIHLTEACRLRGDLCCLWKLLGDCCVLVHPLDASVVHMNIPSVLLNSKSKVDQEFTKVGKSEILALSSRFYCRAINLQPDGGALWHDLGISYFRQAEESDDNTKTKLATKATDAVKKAITLEPSNFTFWTSLGVLSASSYVNDPALSQHCFLKSIQVEPNNVQAWSNLATLYLAQGHIKLAHETFKVAQSLDPSFVNSWVGQAIIAETIGSEETMDLYRHATELGLHEQAASSYSFWVAKVMSDEKNCDSHAFKENIRNMNAVATATMQMSKQCDRKPTCAWSSTILGYLLEYSGLNQSAEGAYSRANQTLVSLKEASSMDEEQSAIQEKINKTAANLARVLCKNGKYKEAVETYQLISPLTNFHDVCGLALACFKLGGMQQSLKAYKQAGQLASTDSEKFQVMVAMAMVCMKMGKPDEAKTLLYRCFQTCKDGLHTLCALGIELNDKTLVGAAVEEILKQKSTSHSEEELEKDSLLIAAAGQLCNDPKLAIREVQKALHRIPDSLLLRNLLCRLLVTFKNLKGIRSVALISRQSLDLSIEGQLSDPLNCDSQLWMSCKRHHGHVDTAVSNATATLASGHLKSRYLLSCICFFCSDFPTSQFVA